MGTGLCVVKCHCFEMSNTVIVTNQNQPAYSLIVLLLKMETYI